MGSEKATGDLRKVQLLQLKMLDAIDEACEIMGITYYIIAGTLLGAVRHDGFIPWDSDIDIAMFREDYEKFLTIGNSIIDDRFFIQSDHTDKYHQSSFAKVRALETKWIITGNKSHSNYNGFYVDIFPLDDIKKKPNNILHYYGKFLKLLQRVKAFRNGKYYSATKVKTMFSFLISIPTFLFPKKTLSEFINKSITRNNGKGYLFVTNFCSKYGITNQFMSKSIYGTPVRIKFENRLYYAPKEYLTWLKNIYGDYMILPKGAKNVSSIPDIYEYDLGPYKNITEEK